MCGISGSGKTTYAKAKEKEGYIRLSIDESMWETYGQMGVDYDKELYGQYSAIIENRLKEKLIGLIVEGKNIVIDFSFRSRKSRDLYRRLIESEGGWHTLIYMKTPKQLLKERLEIRNSHISANAPYKSQDFLDKYFYAFESPDGENEIIIEQK